MLLDGQVPYERILNAHSEPGNWLTYSGDYQAHGYSALDQINTSNVDRLKVAWMYQTGVLGHFETTPLVFDGVMYITEPLSGVTALDLRTGRPIWTYKRPLPKGVVVCCGLVNRGLAVLDDQLFLGTVDAHLVALDMRTGRVRWDVEVADYKAAYSITAGNETWAGDSWKTGGAPTWVTGAYDPEANLVYWGTGNPSPDMIGDERNGDNLYSDALIALDADTGKLKWHFQFTPHDTLDMDANQVPVLVDADFRHGTRPAWASHLESGGSPEL